VSVGSAIAVSVADALTEVAGGERSRQAEVAIAPFPNVVGVPCTSHRAGGCSGGDRWRYNRVDTSCLDQDGRNVAVSGGPARGGEV
jgi:hypothetical protein